MLFIVTDRDKDLSKTKWARISHIEDDNGERIGGYYLYNMFLNESQIKVRNEFAAHTPAGLKHLLGNGNHKTLGAATAAMEKIK